MLGQWGPSPGQGFLGTTAIEIVNSINKCLLVSECVVAMNTAGLWGGKRNMNFNVNLHLFQANFKPASVIYTGNAEQLSDSVPRKALAHGYKFSLQRTEKSGTF